MVEFVSYDGVYPYLCSGTLIVRIDGKEVSLGRCLESGGGCCWNDPDDTVWQGEWDISDIPHEYEKYRNEIKKVVNDNVHHGCCGGCL